ncbi:MAG: putative holliday junction resolvase [Halothiobacillaceae bacterium]|nr:MAG: putative holliday junction resolvase [Halothiobacillaceae bacterium]
MSSKHQTVLAFDFGSKRIGVAVGQTVTSSATPLETLMSRNNQPWAAITRLITTWQPDGLIIGLPLNMDGSEQEMTLAARRFSQRLHGRYHLPVYLVDERLTSVAAHERLTHQHRSKRSRQGKTTVDKIAAQLILETWLTG